MCGGLTLIAALAIAALFSPALVKATNVEVSTSTQQSSGFGSGALTPFSVCTTQSPNYCEVTNFGGLDCVKSWWEETYYNGTRDTKGAECCSSFETFKEGWYGFQFYLPSPGFPNNKTATIAQLFQDGDCNSWAGMLVISNDNCTLQWRDYCGDFTITTIQNSVPFNQWNPIIIHFIASQTNQGELQVWWNPGIASNAPTVNLTAINFGFGVWATNPPDTLAVSNEIVLKFGQYDWDVDNYTTNETRTIYFNNVAQVVGPSSSGWEIVNPSIILPAAPADLTATAGNAQIVLNWKSVSGASSYNVYSSTTNKGPYAPIAGVTGVAFTNTGLINGTTYYYVVTATNVDGAGPCSAQASATPLPPLPDVPSGLTAVAGDGRVVLNWNSAANAAGYNVYNSTASGHETNVVGSNVPGLSFTNTGLADGTMYYFVVTATNAAGGSAASDEVSARPVSLAPPQLGFETNVGQIQFAWPTTNTGWTLQAQTNALGTNWVTIAGSDATNQWVILLNAGNGSVFYRLVYP